MLNAVSFNTHTTVRAELSERIIRRGDVSAVADLGAVLQRLTELDRNARLEIEEAKRQAHDEGYAEGFSVGSAAAAKQVIFVASHEITQWKLLSPKLERLVRDCIEAFVGEQINGTAAYGRHIGRLFAQVDSHLMRRVLVAPSRVDAVQVALQDALPATALATVQVEARDELGVNDLVLETKSFVVDARLQTQVDHVMNALRQSLRALPQTHEVTNDDPYETALTPSPTDRNIVGAR
jgi:flagellar biosynthesis/type III secretory pathway protein FliH